MTAVLEKIRVAVGNGSVRLSDHAFERLLTHDISYQEILDGLGRAEAIEDYPDYFHGPCVLVLQQDAKRRPFHVVWGLSKGDERRAIVVTAYRPDPEKWDETWRRRRT